jgi:hypothetical protein
MYKHVYNMVLRGRESEMTYLLCRLILPFREKNVLIQAKQHIISIV